MTKPRSSIISLEATPYYHCMSRCVRRAFLCGEDRYSGRNFDHRKPWLVERLALLEKVFAIQIAAYAIMSNHYHLVLHVDIDQANTWGRDEIIARWRKLYRGPTLIQRYLENESLSESEFNKIDEITKVWKSRLCSISWFMSNLNEYIARMANKEDQCTGRFWEGRFKSQALLDESALLSCMAYVDLNPIRAGLTKSLQSSDYTSIQHRIKRIKKSGQKIKAKPALMKFAESISSKRSQAMISFGLKDYIELVDWSGRSVRSDKKGYIQKRTPKVLASLGINPEQWQQLSTVIQKESDTMLSGLDKLAMMERRIPKKKSA